MFGQELILVNLEQIRNVCPETGAAGSDPRLMLDYRVAESAALIGSVAIEWVI